MMSVGRARLFCGFMVLSTVVSCKESTANDDPFQITDVSPAALSGGTTATITGMGFSEIPANNSVTVDGLAATVTAASPTSLTVTVPALPCKPGYSGNISVTVGGQSAQKSHPIQPGTLHTLAVGASVILNTAAAARCNELHNTNTNAQYYVSVYNTSATYNTTGARFELKGTAGTAGAMVATSNSSQSGRPRRQASRGFDDSRWRRVRSRAEHMSLLERDLVYLRQNRHLWRPTRSTARLNASGIIA